MEDCKFEEGMFKNSNISEELKAVIEEIAQCYRKEVRNDLGFLSNLFKLYSLGTYEGLAYADSCRFAKHGEKKNLYELCEKYFGFSRKYLERCLRVIDRFMTWNASGPLDFRLPILRNYTICKLFELLPLSISQIDYAAQNEEIKPSSTKDDLRHYVKSIKEGIPKGHSVVEETNVSDKEAVFDSGKYTPEKWFDREYFKRYGKKDLIDIIWALQTKYVPYRSNNGKN